MKYLFQKPAIKDSVSWLKEAEIPLPVKIHLDISGDHSELTKYVLEQGVSTFVGVDFGNGSPAQLNTSGYIYLKLDATTIDWTEAVRDVTNGEMADLVTAFNFLDQVESPWMILQSLSRIIAPGGYLVLTIPNLSPWQRALRPKRWSELTDDTNKKMLNAKSLRFLLEHSGWDVLDIKAPIDQLGHFGDELMLGKQLFAVARKL